jgi:hypothetical protein
MHQNKTEIINFLIDDYEISLSYDALGKSLTRVQNMPNYFYKFRLFYLIQYSLQNEKNLFIAIMTYLNSDCDLNEFQYFFTTQRSIDYNDSRNASGIIENCILCKLHDLYEFPIECVNITRTHVREAIHEYINNKQTGKNTKRAI